MAKNYMTPEEIQKRFDSLPTDIKTALYGVDMLDVIKKLGEKYKLHIDQTGILEAETADVMMGFSKREDYVASLSDSLNIDHVQAEAIAKDINEQLFVKIQDSMKKMEGNSVQTPPPAPVPIAPVIPIAPAAPQPPKPDLSAADAMLQSKTVSAPAPVAPPAAAPKVKEEPPKPSNYSADPYREPPL